MNLKNATEKAGKLKQKINDWNQSYFNENKEIFSENLRDQLKKDLIKLETDFPELVQKDSPTQRVGVPLDGKLPKIKHLSRKYSLSDVFAENELREFDKRVKKFLNLDEIEYSCELKIDGINITLWYKNGILEKAITRGDGLEGEDVTHSIKTCHNLPLKIREPIDLEISGECFINKPNFLKIQKNNPDQKFANSRNLTAGSVRQLDAKIASQRYLQIFLYELGKNNISTNINSQQKLFQFFDKLNLPHEKEFSVFANIEEVINFCKKCSDKKFREKIFYDIDGIVIKIHNFGLRKRLGFTAKTAKFAVAWKFPAEQKYTKLQKIDWQVGRTGSITPVGILEPVDLAGSKVSRATLHNADEISRKKIKINDQVIIQKAGDIIPEVLEPMIDLRNGTEMKIIFPEKCPSCKAVLNKDEKIWRCENFRCEDKIREKMVYFAKTLNIENLGEQTIKELLRKNLVKNLAYFWNLNPLDLANLEGFKNKKIQNLLDSLNSRKNLVLSEFFTALGIRHIGEENAKLISNFLHHEWGNFNLEYLCKNLGKIDSEKLKNIDGIGEVVAESFIEFAKNPETVKLLEDFIKSEIQIIWENKKSLKFGFFTDKKFVITGSFSNFSREELKKIITNNGGKFLSAISQNVDYLICGENAGSKKNKAEELKIKILETDDLEKIIHKNLHTKIEKKDNDQSSLF